MTHWWCHENYGQLLQCYALQKVLKARGHDPFLIRYRPISSWQRKLARFVHDPLLLYQRIRPTSNYAGQRAMMVQERDFERFRFEYIASTSQSYSSYRQLQSSGEVNADVYICGSDQVWNENFVMWDKNGRPWFLGFGDKNIKRVAYAPSFGATSLSPGYIRFIKPLFRNLDHISVREAEGVDLCRQVERYDAVQVLDPTLLLKVEEYRRDFFNSDLPRPTARSYAMFYLLKSDCIIPWDDICGQFRHRHLSGIFVTVYGDTDGMFDEGRHPTIPEWLQWIDSSEIVITNSFHGTAFAILMNRPFVVLPRVSASAGMNSRLTSLLTTTGLQARILSSGRSLGEILDMPIDWAVVNQKIASKRIESLNFLKSCGL